MRGVSLLAELFVNFRVYLLNVGASFIDVLVCLGSK